MVTHPWGRTNLVASQLTRAFACHYPRPFFVLMEAVSQWFTTHLDGLHDIINTEDLGSLSKCHVSFLEADMIAVFFTFGRNILAYPNVEKVVTYTAYLSRL